MVKVEILLSTLAAAACTASVGIAVWKLVLDRPKDSNELARRKTPGMLKMRTHLHLKSVARKKNERKETTKGDPKFLKRPQNVHALK